MDGRINKGNARYGAHRTAFEKNKQRIFATQTVCGICGKLVDFSLKFPHPFSATVDHIVPLDRGGHPSDMDNLQLAHLCCNRQKSNNLQQQRHSGEQIETVLSNRNLPQSMDWRTYRPK